MGFDELVGPAFIPCLVLVRVVGPSEHIGDFRVGVSTVFLLLFVIFVFVLLVPFS